MDFKDIFLNLFLPSLDDSMIALISGIFVFFHAGKNNNMRRLCTERVIKLPGNIALFGGGLAIAVGFQSD